MSPAEVPILAPKTPMPVKRPLVGVICWFAFRVMLPLTVESPALTTMAFGAVYRERARPGDVDRIADCRCFDARTRQSVAEHVTRRCRDTAGRNFGREVSRGGRPKEVGAPASGIGCHVWRQ